MDEIVLLRALASEAERSDVAARAAALGALEASIERASAAPSTASPRPRHRGVLALAGVGALTGLVAGVLLISSGPSAEPAGADVLRQAAIAAAAAAQPSSTPGPNQFLYMETKRMELQEWGPGSATVSGGGATPGRKGTFSALIRWREEAWLSAKQRGRQRLVMESPRFLSSTERHRWHRAGSPLPAPFNDERGGGPGVHTIEARRGVQDVEDISGPGFGHFSGLPTEPKALRLAIERHLTSGRSSDNRPTAKPIDTGQVIAELWHILEQPNTTPARRAAVFGALAELPEIGLDRNAKDLVGRPGSALSYEVTGVNGYGHPRIRAEYIFDPETSELLGNREVITNSEKRGVPSGTVIRELAYLESGVVDSTHERPGKHSRGPVATASKGHRN